MAKTKIDAVEMIRRIREGHAEELKNASREERIRFYRERARQVHTEAQRQLASSSSPAAPEA